MLILAYNKGIIYPVWGETGAGWRTGLVDFFDLSEYYWTHRKKVPYTDQRYDYAQM